MARRFTDVIGGRHLLLNAAADIPRSVAAVLPNGDPLWGGTGGLGAEVPPDFDFVNHDWTLEFWARHASPAGTPLFWFCTADGVSEIWRVSYTNASSTLTFTQWTTTGTTYRQKVGNSSALAANTTYLVHILCPAGGTPSMYYNLGENALGASTAPTGTPRVMTAAGRHHPRGGASAATVGNPAMYRRLLSAEDRALNYAAMYAA